MSHTSCSAKVRWLALGLAFMKCADARGSAGCGTEHAGGLLKGTLESSGYERSFVIHVPEGYEKDEAHPVVFAFHGKGGSGEVIVNSTRLTEEQWTGDKLVVYPDGWGGFWAGADYSILSVAEDLSFVRDLVAHLRADFCVDSSRIYATGHSNGGGMVDNIACHGETGKDFAAFAPIAGAFYANNDDNYEECDPARALTPVLQIHGGADITIPYEGGKGSGGMLPSIPDWLDRWAARSNCGEPTTDVVVEDKITSKLWKCQGKAGALRHYFGVGLEHKWPNPSEEMSWPIEGNDLIFDFFDSFTKPKKCRSRR